jgi:Histidine kinase-, DNA gyrase B-, and HSP90-like ATPase
MLTVVTTPSFALRPRGDRVGKLSARVAVYSSPAAPPEVEELIAADPATLIERIFERTAEHSTLPVIALREIIENLVHAAFEGAVVSILDDGRVVRVSDRGPGIQDKVRALQPGYSTADASARKFIRGVGSGLSLVTTMLASQGGNLQIEDNLDGGTVATMIAGDGELDGVSLGDPPPVSTSARHILALLLELGSASAETLAQELSLDLCGCGRDLSVLEQHGVIKRASDGARSLTPVGAEMLTSLF